MHYKSLITDNSPNCKCGQPETLEHVLYFCERYSRSRFEWGKEISNILNTESVPLRFVAWETLFGQTDGPKSGNNQKLLLATLNFLKNTRRFGHL